MLDKFFVVNFNLIYPMRGILNVLQYVKLTSNVLFNHINIWTFLDNDLFYVRILSL